MSPFGRLRISRTTVISVAVGLMLAVFLLRLSVDDPVEPIMFLLVVPIGLLAAEFGLSGGLAGAATASALVLAWDAIQAPELTWIGYSSRFVVFLVSGATIGALTQSRSELEQETTRWFDQSADLNCVADLDGNLVRVNRAFEEMLGHRTVDLIGKPYISFVHPDDVEETQAVAAQLADGALKVAGFENRYLGADGEYHWFRWSATTDTRRALVYASARDITSTRELQEQLRDLAHRDPLTGLPNRRHFEDEAGHDLEVLRRYGPGGALFVCDIDRFKQINDTYGHLAGDRALRVVAKVMMQRTRASDTCARIGGDEFAILFPGVQHSDAESLAEELLDLVREVELDTDGQSIKISWSIGIVMFEQGGTEDLESLMASADAAMYEAKRGGGAAYSFASPTALTQESSAPFK